MISVFVRYLLIYNFVVFSEVNYLTAASNIIRIENRNILIA